MQSEELKPCPFCGGEPLEFRVPGFGRSWRIECMNCDAGPSSSLDIEVTRTIWNTRVEAALSAAEPVAVYKGNGLIDCGDSGHHNVELLKLIPANTPLYMSVAPSLSRSAQIDAIRNWSDQKYGEPFSLSACNDLLSALSAQVQDVAGWQPIETAPRDGSKFIGFDGRRPFLCYMTKHYVKYPHEEGGPTFRDVWSGDHYDCISPEHPTHWMSLPAAPAKQEGCK